MLLDDDEVTYTVGIFDSINFNRFENVKYPFLMVTTEIQVVKKTREKSFYSTGGLYRQLTENA